MKRIKEILEHRQNWYKQSELENQQTIETWTQFHTLLYQRCNDPAEFRQRIVQQAYDCTVSTEVYTLLHPDSNLQFESKLWRALRFLARPIIDCRVLRDVAKRQPQFQNIRIVPVPPMQKMSIGLEYQIDLCDAWTRLMSVSPSADIVNKFSEQFKQDCTKSYSLHCEMQLFLHYEHKTTPIPTLDYFGCSKKACLLCDTFLQSLLNPISTRGRHGICYAAWGVPQSESFVAKVALEKLESFLVSRIKKQLDSDKIGSMPAVPQSTFVSELSYLTLEDQLQRETDIKKAKQAEYEMREEKAILCVDLSQF